MPEIFPLTTGVQDFLACQSFLELRSTRTDFSKNIGVILRFNGIKSLANEALLEVVDNTSN